MSAALAEQPPVEGVKLRPGWDPNRDFTDNSDPNAELPPPQRPEPESVDTAVELAVDTLTGDLRDFMLDRLRFEQSKRPWHERSEADQRDTVGQVEAACRRIVRQAVELIAGHGRRSIKATVEQCVVKDGIKATLSLSKHDENRHHLIDATGLQVLLVVADPEEFTGERAPVDVKPDQGDLVREAAAAVHSEAQDNHAETPFT